MNKRCHCISVRVSPVELIQLDRERVRRQRGAYLRDTWLGKPTPVAVPAINQSAWQELARAAANLNQLARAANVGELPELSEVRTALSAFRAALLSPV